MKKINGNTLNKHTRNFIKAIMQVAAYHIEQGNLHVEAAEAPADLKDMSSILSKYRVDYVTVVRTNGTTSLDKGDEVAVALRSLDLGEVLAMADVATNSPAGHHLEKYDGLNAGSQRMNAGNRIRAAVKNGKFTLGQLLAAIELDLDEEDGGE